MKRTASKRKPGRMADADKAFSLRIRERDGSCRAAGTDGTTCAGNLQCCHLVSRRYRALRWNDIGAIAMCQAHHMRYTRAPLEWERWVDDNEPTGWEWHDLRLLALTSDPEKPADALARMRGAV